MTRMVSRFLQDHPKVTASLALANRPLHMIKGIGAQRRSNAQSKNLSHGFTLMNTNSRGKIYDARSSI